MDKVAEKIRAAKSIAVMGHVNSDPDSIGSCFAFAHMMRLEGKRAVVYFNEQPEDRLRFMGDDYVIYNGTNAEDHDLCVCLDCGDMGRLGDRKAIFDKIANSVSIDHHRTNTYFADENYVDGNAPAAAELLCRLFKFMNLKLDNYASKQLYTALSSDTGGFRFSSVTPQTMRTAADLLEFDFDHAEISRLLYESMSFNEVRFRASIMQNIRSYADGKICLVSVSGDLKEKFGFVDGRIPNVVEIPRSVEKVEIAVSIGERADGIRVNLRSNGAADVSKVALKYGGGGHVRAAGCTITDVSLEEAEKIIVEECRGMLE